MTQQEQVGWPQPPQRGLMGHLNNQDFNGEWWGDEEPEPILRFPRDWDVYQYLLAAERRAAGQEGRGDPVFGDAAAKTRPRAPETSTVYFIQESPAGPIKIGKSVNPVARMREFQTHHAATLVLMAVTRDHVEAALHQRFATLRLRGEWFRAGPELVEFIQQLQAVAAW